MDNVVNSALATALAEVITLPICNIKTNYQNSDLGLRDVVQKIYANGGVASFYRASLPALCAQVFSTSAKYALYRAIDIDNKVAKGVVSGVLVSLVTHPIDVVKIHWQMRTSVLGQGAGIMYRGYSKTLGKVTVGSALFFPMYDVIRESITKNPVVASLLTATISTLIIHPIDYLRTRHVYGNTLWQGTDVRVYYRGLLVNMARIIPHFTITMTCIYYLEKL
jgi:hypothetical protein